MTSPHLDKRLGSLTSRLSITGLITPTRPRSRLLQRSPNRVTSRRASSAGDDASHCCVCRVLIACSAARRRLLLLPRYTSRPHPQFCRACSSAIIPLTTTYKATHRLRRLIYSVRTDSPTRDQPKEDPEFSRTTSHLRYYGIEKCRTATSTTSHPATTAPTSACAKRFASTAGTGLCILPEGLCLRGSRREPVLRIAGPRYLLPSSPAKRPLSDLP